MAEDGLEIKIQVPDLEKVIRKLGPELISGSVGDFLKRSVITVQGKARMKAPVDTGLMRSDIKFEVDSAQPPTWGKVGTSVFYAPYQEFGTGIFVGKGFHWPPGQALGLWAERHGFDSGYQVARIIGRKGGLEPRRFMRGGLEESLSAIKGFLAELGREIQRKWEGRR